MTVLMLASQDDFEADLVARVLDGRGIPLRWLDTAWFPHRASVSAELTPHGWRTSIATPHGTFETAEVSAVFYTQSQPFTFPPGLSEPELRFVTVEARFGLGGLLASIRARWVSHPSAIADAEYRIRQMAVAARCGFRLPASTVTNELVHAKRFAADHGPVVYKAIMHKLLSEDDQIKLIYTTPIDPDTLDNRVTFTPHLFQTNVRHKAFDARVVVTGSAPERGACLGVAIRTDDPGAVQDWRTNLDALTYEPVEIPAKVADACHACLAALGLRMGVFDFSVDASGTWWYLEVNPGGRWAWLQDETGLPIAEAVAAELINVGDPERN
jgi:hypothetical protein